MLTTNGTGDRARYSTTPDGRELTPSRAVTRECRLTRQAGSIVPAAISKAMARRPGTNRSGLTLNPVWISAWRARPKGISGDASTAITKASTPPAMPITVARAMTTLMSW